jgi:hypothetical protein
MKKRPSTQTMMNSDPDCNKCEITPEMRDLIVAYMEACNSGKNAEADLLMEKIRQENIKRNER